MSDVRVCVDASIIANVFFVQPLSAKATALVQQWAADNAQMVAPDLLVYEVLNAAHQYRRRGLLSHALEQQVN